MSGRSTASTPCRRSTIVLEPMANKVSLSKTCLVRFDKNRYSVEARAAGRPLEIRAYSERVEFWQDGQVVGRHPRAFGSSEPLERHWSE
jgi:hypothetical protein